MPDPIRVTRAVRRCAECEEAEESAFQFRDWMSLDVGIGQGCEDCSDGWVDVAVDEECSTCAPTLRPGRVWASEYLDNERVRLGNAWIDCPDCGGSGRRLHDWATGWCYQDEVMDRAGNVWRLAAIGGMHHFFPDDHALVLSDPSHRPEPMRWSTP